MPAAELALRWAHDLHFGQGLGPLWRGLTIVTGLVLPIFAVTGGAMWLFRQRRRVARAAAGRLNSTAFLTGTKRCRPTLQLPPPDLTPWHMFHSADLVVKSVIVLLLLASVVTWTILLAKWLELALANRGLRETLALANRRGEPGTAGASSNRAAGTARSLLVAAQTELALSGELPVDGIKSRIALRLQRVEALLARRMARGTGVLASIGSCAPFIGLFGTVWGIMDSFVGISRMQTTNLAVVAPGIAEALLATACGLVAAIPAVVIYNIFARVVAGYRLLLGDLSTAVLRARVARPRPRVAARRRRHRARPCCATRRSSAMSLEHGFGRTGRGARHQRHAVHRRDAGAADHLHGRRSAGHRGCEGRSAGLRPPRPSLGRTGRSI